MRLKHTLNKLKKIVRTSPKKYTIPIGVVLVLTILYGVVFFIQKPISFTYGGATCSRYLLLFPSTHRTVSNTQFDILPKDEVKIGETTIATRSVCFIPKVAPTEGVARVSIAPFGGWFAKKTFSINIAKPPTANIELLDKPISTTKPLVISLSDTDTTFTYVFTIKNKEVGCTSVEKGISCDIEKLGLNQGRVYESKMTRRFNSAPAATLAEKKIKTLSATRITKTSVKKKQVIYNKPKTISLQFDKELVGVRTILYQIKDKKRTKVETKTSFKGKKATTTFVNGLSRSASFELDVAEAEAVDGSGLEDVYKLPFKTSGGPSVVAVSGGNTGVSMGSTVVVTFDQSLSSKQAISSFVSVSGGAKVTGKSGSQVFVSLAGVPKCGDFTIKVAKGVKSNYEIASTSTYTRTARTVCHTVSTIGYSSQGRPINAYHFGNGGTSVLFTGAIHGSESSTYSLMQAWIQDLEANARSIPRGKNIVVVPVINPDGLANGSRTNARNVDLNRNFATNDWKKDITTVDNKPFKSGGGKSAMSEPETKAIAGLASRLRPAVVLSYHSIGGVLAANQAGRSNALASTYSQQSGYANTTGQTSETFEYSISGTADDWYAQALGVPSILIELGSHSYHEFERNKNAMWLMVRL